MEVRPDGVNRGGLLVELDGVDRVGRHARWTRLSSQEKVLIKPDKAIRKVVPI